MSTTRLNFRGKILNWRTVDMFEVAERKANAGGLRVIQGSYNTGVSASAGTHNGGGAVDCWPNRGSAYVNKYVLELRKVGFAAWHRSPSQGPWTSHIHAIGIGDSQLSGGAYTQVREYYAGQNGLASHRSDDGPRIKIVTWEEYMRAHPTVMVVSLRNAVNQLSGKKKSYTLGVVRIQRCLNEKIGSRLSCDGIAGPVTREEYKKWQRKCGYKQKNINGIPTYWTLKKLLANRYKTYPLI